VEIGELARSIGRRGENTSVTAQVIRDMIDEAYFRSDLQELSKLKVFIKEKAKYMDLGYSHNDILNKENQFLSLLAKVDSKHKVKREFYEKTSPMYKANKNKQLLL